jgi:hypothetical protein
MLLSALVLLPMLLLFEENDAVVAADVVLSSRSNPVMTSSLFYRYRWSKIMRTIRRMKTGERMFDKTCALNSVAVTIREKQWKECHDRVASRSHVGN